MELSARSVGWLRQLDGAVAGSKTVAEHDGSPDPWALWWSGVGAATMARRVPAWTEVARAALAALVTACGPQPEALDLLAARTSLAGLRSLLGPDDPRRNGPDDPGDVTRELCARWQDIVSSGDDAVISLGGLALWLHDRAWATDLHHDRFQPWWSMARPRLLANAVDVTEGTNAKQANAKQANAKQANAKQANAKQASSDQRTDPVTALLIAAQAPVDAGQLLELAVGAAVEEARAIRGSGPALPGPGNGDNHVAANRPAAGSRIAAGWLAARAVGEATRGEVLAGAVDLIATPHWDATTGGYSWGVADGATEALLAVAEACSPGLWPAVVAEHASPQPQVVGVDFPAVALRRAEWDRGFLTITLDPLVVDRSARTTFRLIGAEPRVWWISGLDNVTTEMSATGVTVHAPRVAATLEFAPSSY